MARSVEVDVFGIARGILPAKVADMPGGNILTFIDRHVGHISQIERRREHERLCPCDAPAVAFRHTHQFLPLGIVTGKRPRGKTHKCGWDTTPVPKVP